MNIPQIAGRAGRRGIDEVGKVWLCCNLFDLPPVYDLQNMLSGKPQTLTSKFKISYTICLNNVASSENNVIDFVNRSMIINDIESEIKNYDKTISDIETILERKTLTYNNIRTNQEIMSEYINHKNKIGNLSNKERKKTARNISKLEDENRFIKEIIKYIKIWTLTKWK